MLHSAARRNPATIDGMTKTAATTSADQMSVEWSGEPKIVSSRAKRKPTVIASENLCLVALPFIPAPSLLAAWPSYPATSLDEEGEPRFPDQHIHLLVP